MVETMKVCIVSGVSRYQEENQGPDAFASGPFPLHLSEGSIAGECEILR